MMPMNTISRAANLAWRFDNDALSDSVAKPILRDHLFRIASTICLIEFCMALWIVSLPIIRSVFHCLAFGRLRATRDVGLMDTLFTLTDIPLYKRSRPRKLIEVC